LTKPYTKTQILWPIWNAKVRKGKEPFKIPNEAEAKQ